MRITVVVLGLVALVSLSVRAYPAGQAPGQASLPIDNGVVTGAELAAIAASQPKDRNVNQTFFRLASYNVNMEHRVSVPQTASVHEKEAELFYVIAGAGTMVTGGQLVNSNRTNAENLTGSGIEGGTSRKIAKGDFVMVPEGVPHWFSAIDGELTLMSLHLPRTPAVK
jgi:mannose-6-phosphate isomerase-like protein (cupin superfamily)